MSHASFTKKPIKEGMPTAAAKAELYLAAAKAVLYLRNGCAEKREPPHADVAMRNMTNAYRQWHTERAGLACSGTAPSLITGPTPDTLPTPEVMEAFVSRNSASAVKFNHKFFKNF